MTEDSSSLPRFFELALPNAEALKRRLSVSPDRREAFKRLGAALSPEHREALKLPRPFSQEAREARAMVKALRQEVAERGTEIAVEIAAKERELAGRKDVLQEVEAWATEKSGGPPPRPADPAPVDPPATVLDLPAVEPAPADPPVAAVPAVTNDNCDPASTPAPRRRPGPQPKADWPMVVARELIRIATAGEKRPTPAKMSVRCEKACGYHPDIRAMQRVLNLLLPLD
ncbi:MAG: hypothetical protein WA397_27320 [Roseiarcus sp.]